MDPNTTPTQPVIVGATGKSSAWTWFMGLHLWVRCVLFFAVAAVVGGGVVALVALQSKPAVPTGVKHQPAASDSQTDTNTDPKTVGDTAKQDETPKETPKKTSTSPSGGLSGGTGGSSGGGSTPSCALPNYPNASCTGVPAGTALAAVNGDMTITVDGTIVDGKNITGCVIVQAANVTIRNSKITCASFYGVASYAGSDDGGLLVEDVEIDCDHHNSTGISYQGATIRRVHIHGCENGLDILTDVTLTDSYIHDIYEGASGHGDGIQASNGSNVVISHNTIYGESTTSAININNYSGGPTTTNTTISNNLLAGGAYALYCPIPASVNFNITGNHFSTIFYPTFGAYGPSSDCDGENQSGNVNHQTGQALTLL